MSESTTIQADGFEVTDIDGNASRVRYDGHPLAEEVVTAERIEEYRQATDLFDMWQNGEELPDIGEWTNLYGEPYWRHKEHSLQFRINGALNRRFEKQIKSPEYFDPDCLPQFHHTEESAVLMLLLTLVRYDPMEVAYQHHHQGYIIRQLQEIHGIGKKTAKKLYEKGVRDYPDVKEHRKKLEMVYRKEALDEIDEKIEQGIHLLEESGFLDEYGTRHFAEHI